MLFFPPSAHEGMDGQADLLGTSPRTAMTAASCPHLVRAPMLFFPPSAHEGMDGRADLLGTSPRTAMTDKHFRFVMRALGARIHAFLPSSTDKG
jgi:hypothetical protein